MAALVAVQMYFVKELVAALFLFTALFAVALVAVLIFFFLDLAGGLAFSWTEAQTARAVRTARAWAPPVEEFSKKLLHHRRSQTAQ